MRVHTWTVEVTTPFNFARMKKRLLQLEKSMYRERNGVLMRTVRLLGEPFRIGIRHDPDRVCLHVAVWGDPSSAQLTEAERLVRHMFSTAVDLSGFYTHVAEDPFLAPLTERFAGVRMVREPDVFECLVKTIISQQLNMAFAGTLTQRLIERAGDAIEVEGERWLVFPIPEQIAQLEYEQLQALQFNRRKAEYIIDLSRQVVNGELDLDRLWHMSDEEVMEELIRIRGVGRWTVECLLLFGLGRPDLLPAADIGLRNAVRHIYGLDHQPLETEVRKIGASRSPWSSYATFYLWESLD